MDVIWKNITDDVVKDIADFYIINTFGDIINKVTGNRISVNSRNTCAVQNKYCVSITISVPVVLYKLFVSNVINSNCVIWFKDNDCSNLCVDNLIQITRKELKEIKFNNNVILNSNLSNKQMSLSNYYKSNNTTVMCYYINEIWTNITNKSVKNVRPWYKISNYGRVFSMATGCLVKTDIINSGYIRVQLRTNDNNRIDALIHRIMMIEFNCIDNYNEMEVNHIDGNGFNNTLDNMNWLSKIDNAKYKANMIEKKFTDEEIKNICIALSNKLSYEEICHKVLNTKYTSRMHTRLYDIHKRKSYKSFTKNYTF